MSDVKLRTLCGTDLKAIVGIWNRALVRDPINESRFARMVFADADFWPGEDSGFFVAERAGDAIGFLRAIIRRWPNDRVGVEPENGYIPVVAVDPPHQRRGAGTLLLDAALDYFRRHGRKRVFVCGNTGSAPGYVFPGVDKEAYPGGMRLFEKAGFVIDHEPVAMSRETVNFDVEAFGKSAWEIGGDVVLATLTPERIPDFMDFLARAFPGDWNIVARNKIKSGALHEILYAEVEGRIVGFCQWEGEHFGPFGVAAEARNKKVGVKLFTEAVRRIREADGRSVWFNWADPDAARFYDRFGLKVTRRFAILRKDY
jgi:GNAT superfamily N-acetyltransferase